MKAYLADLDSRLLALAAAVQAVVNVGQPPAIRTPADLDALLAFRARVGLNGPANAKTLAKAEAILQSPVDQAAASAKAASRAVVQGLEAAIVSAAVAGRAGLLTGDVAKGASIWRDGGLTAYAVAFDKLPADSPLRQLLAPDDLPRCFGPRPVLIPAAEHPRDGLPVAQPWYLVAEVVAFTKAWRQSQIDDEEAKQRNIEAQRQAAARQVEDNLTPPQRIAKLEQQLAALTTKGSQ